MSRAVRKAALFYGGTVNKERIKNFAIDILGCGCDQSVFNSIEEQVNVDLSCGVTLSRKIVIGKRLMIYIATEQNCTPGMVGAVIRDGIDEREKRGYNRLRFVIVSPDASGISEVYNEAFEKSAGRDEKCHIHVVRPDDAV